MDVRIKANPPHPHPTPPHHTRRDLCAALAACHRWRALCLTDALWQPTVQSLWRAWHGKTQIEDHLARQAHGRPFLHPDAPPPVPAPEGQGRSRGRAVLAYRGRCIAESGLLLVGPRWPERYWIKCVWVWVSYVVWKARCTPHSLIFVITLYTHSIEVQDQRDGLVLFSGVGPMACQMWNNQTEHRTILRLGGSGT